MKADDMLVTRPYDQWPEELSGQLALFSIKPSSPSSPTSARSGRSFTHHASQDQRSTITSHPGKSALANTGTHLIDPFSPTQDQLNEVASLLVRYHQQIIPLVKTISSSWYWIDNASQLLAMPALRLAIAAYTSAFFSLVEHGPRAVCLPPIPERGEQSLWPIPPWFRLQTQTLTLLKNALSVDKDLNKPETFHTILFLFRLAILLGDGCMANVHVKALQKAYSESGGNIHDLNCELAVVKINLVSVYQYKDVMVKVVYQSENRDQSYYSIEPDRAHWIDDDRWRKLQTHLLCRSLTWQGRTLQHTILEEARVNVLHLDPGTDRMADESLFELLKAYQSALFLWSYLTLINFSPTDSKVRTGIQELEQFFEEIDPRSLHEYAPRIAFFLLFVSAYASRGDSRHKRFIAQLGQLNPQIVHIKDLCSRLEVWCDPLQVAPILLEELLVEVRQVNNYSSILDESELVQETPHQPGYGPTPTTAPNLQTPLREVIQHIDHD